MSYVGNVWAFTSLTLLKLLLHFGNELILLVFLFLHFAFSACLPSSIHRQHKKWGLQITKTSIKRIFLGGRMNWSIVRVLNVNYFSIQELGILALISLQQNLYYIWYAGETFANIPSTYNAFPVAFFFNSTNTTMVGGQCGLLFPS